MKKKLQKYGTITLAGALLLSSNLPVIQIANAETKDASSLIINEVYGGGGKVSKDGMKHRSNMTLLNYIIQQMKMFRLMNFL